ncbi:MAG: PASTA domain-containing protein [Spirochaetales bacterium]
MGKLLNRIRDFLPGDHESPENKYFKAMVFSVIAIIIFTVTSGVVTFLFSLEGEAQTTVPDINGQELPEALLALQERDLAPRVQLRTTDDPSLRGYVIDQDPSAGSLVRSGRAIDVSVSRGAVIEELRDYVGMDLEEVRFDLRAITGAGVPFIEIGTVQRVFDEEEPGTVLEQSPEAGDEITGPIELDLVVSRGPEVEEITLSDYEGQNYEEVISDLSELELPFVFEAVPPGPEDEDGAVVVQEPEAGSTVEPGSLVTLTIAEPEDLDDEEIFGILQRNLPEYPVPIELELEAVNPEGDTETLVSMNHPGGQVAIPYVVRDGSTLVLSRADETILRQLVEADDQE